MISYGRCHGPRRSFVVAEAIAARVVAEHPHPNADRLRIAVVEVDGTNRRVVYGGTRVLEVGDVVPVALPGTRLTADSSLPLPRLRVRAFRGVRSEAMLCSSDELGWTVGGLDEVQLLGDEHPVGEPVRGTRAFHWLYGDGPEARPKPTPAAGAVGMSFGEVAVRDAATVSAAVAAATRSFGILGTLVADAQRRDG